MVIKDGINYIHLSITNALVIGATVASLSGLWGVTIYRLGEVERKVTHLHGRLELLLLKEGITEKKNWKHPLSRKLAQNVEDSTLSIVDKTMKPEKVRGFSL